MQQIFDLRADVFLLLITVLLGFLAVFFQILKGTRRGRNPSEDPLVALLAKPEVVELLKSNSPNAPEILKQIEAQRAADQRDPSPLGQLLHKISHDIQWDVAGLIGIAVTIVLLYMVVAGTIQQVPK